MVEITTGQSSFNDYKFDFDLIVMICNGLRPKFNPGIPDSYVELANQYEWLNIIENKSENESENESENKSESRIKKQFLESDETFKDLLIITEKLNNVFTSKPYFISEISTRLSKLYFSKTAGDIEIPDDIS
ncbi:hypothetical protein C2G38_2158709 [Gigaspora rosea]|uniref:Uncharacterized protein n=1 Tax=Gigaspora rosea TaxID=44941 RepID=A0A397W1S9_9GLOM|nr:hypothetical protein C2G38_2158709 [Gigaspora rosea]